MCEQCELSYSRMNSEKFQNFQIQPESSFMRENNKNDNQGEFIGFERIHPLYDFPEFSEIVISIMAFFV